MSRAQRSCIALRGEDRPISAPPYSSSTIVDKFTNMKIQACETKGYRKHQPREISRQEIIIQCEWPFSIFFRGFSAQQEEYLEGRLQRFQQHEEELAKLIDYQEGADLFDPKASLDVVEKVYYFARRIHDYLNKIITWDQPPTVSCRLPDVFPRGTPLESKKYALDARGKSDELEASILIVREAIIKQAFEAASL